MKTTFLIVFFSIHAAIYSFSQLEGNALNFNSSNGYCQADLPTVFDNISLNDFTLECWVKQESGSTSKRIFFAQKDANNFCSILVNSGNTLYFFLNDNGISYSVNTQVNLSSSVWTHLAFTWDASSNTITSYINGIQINGISGGVSSAGTDGIMTIGARTDGQQIYKGSIDEFRVWDDIRTPCEIVAGMNNTFTAGQPNLIASYDFNQGIAGGTNSSETTLNELTNLYDASLIDFTLSGTTSNWVTSGIAISQTNNNSETIHTIDEIETCDSLIWVDGNTYYTNNYTATHSYISTVTGCDSIVHLNLNLHFSTTGTDVQTACDSYTWIDNITYYASNTTATHTITGGAASGCDSVVTLHLTLNSSSSGTDVQTACGSYTWIDGNTYFANNDTSTFTLINSTGCDSIVTLNLTVNSPSTGTDIQTACGSYTWMDGNTYFSDNDTSTFTLMNSLGCDSIVTLNLTIHPIPDVSTSISGITMTASETGSAYQWITCPDHILISNAISQSFTAEVNGEYAVIVDNGTCRDTSACMVINTVGLNEFANTAFELYPNPTKKDVTIRFNDPSALLEVRDIKGKLFVSAQIYQESTIDMTSFQSGVYLFTLKSMSGFEVFRITKE
ncbi:LamG-like jellyroll fold domain-containing protein [uncultured Fluviicola sp.]|uniref:LamG-like jellyroll fold domain-containing protein n=1 Tax=uncultured Fluviicola sp. TaxID=463303 RepID=UPI0025D2EEFC|nr:LamG-like jellyroll fold domain-containing protein [uncultured Fluviicola sp.]